MEEEKITRDEDTFSEVPPVYSPRPIPVSRAISELELTHPQLNSNGPTYRDTPASSTHSQSRTQSPPMDLPGLISPQFTPPSTPGTQTPAIPLHQRPARSIPVDSTIDDPKSSNCGTKHPKLLEKLPVVNCVVRARIPTTTGAEMFLHLYQNDQDNKEHLAIVFGNQIRSKSLDAVREGETEMDRLIRGAYTGRLYPGRVSSKDAENTESKEGNVEEHQHSAEPTLVRIHSECYTGETVWSARCDCGEQLDEAARLMSLPCPSDPSRVTGGIIIYLRQEGRGIGLSEKLKAYNLQDLGSDTVEANLLLRHPADARSYGLATAILQDLGQNEIRLLTNNPDKVRAVEGPNREVIVKERVAMIPLAWRGAGGIRSKEVGGYLKTKIEKMGHMLQMAEAS
ncbi:GTP cyclohydrolase II-domain-containing protein [Xylogone sp. PMI_703]|nr:GTP cyclohydrolase II-domain-containing protein [Xylogone sp. PMI_703]